MLAGLNSAFTSRQIRRKILKFFLQLGRFFNSGVGHAALGPGYGLSLRRRVQFRRGIGLSLAGLSVCLTPALNHGLVSAGVAE